MKPLLSAIGITAGLLGALYAALYSLFDGLPASKAAAFVLVGIIALAAGALMVMWIMVRMTRTGFTDIASSSQSPHQYFVPDEPRRQLPEPRTITVPRYTVNATARPLPYPSVNPDPSPIVLRSVVDGGELTVPLSRLAQFVALETPSRSQWTGDRAAYGDCVAFCESHGLLTRTANGGAKWKPEYDQDTRVEWASQFDQVDR